MEHAGAAREGRPRIHRNRPTFPGYGTRTTFFVSVLPIAVRR